MIRRAVACAALALSALGCASTPQSARLPPPPTAQVRDAAGRVAVQVTSDDAPVGATRPPAGALEGAGRGLLGGAGVGLQFAADSGRDLRGTGDFGVAVWLLANAVVFPVCLVGGTLYGTIASMPEEELSSRLAALRGAFDAAGPELGLRGELVAALSRDGATPTGAGGADATLDVRVARRGLFGKSGFDPETSVVVEIAAELRLADGTAPYRATFVHVGPLRAFTEWTDHADALAAEVRLAVRQLAERVADELLLVDGDALR